MKRKDLKKLPKKSLIGHLKIIKYENRELLGQITQKDKKIEQLEAKLAHYQAYFGKLVELSDDEPQTPQERGRIERQVKFIQQYQNNDKE